MQLFYHPEINQSTKEVRFDKKESGHIIKSLRKVTGDKLHITNGKGYLSEGDIINTNPNKCTIKIVKTSFEKPLPYQLHIAVAPTKKNDRFEWFLEKATEIGITKITPIICDHSERRKVKLDRFERVLQSAMKQSLQCYLPQIEKPISFSDFLNQSDDNSKFIAHCEDHKKSFLKDLVKPKENITLLIGPEGDFSLDEIEKALAKDFKPVSLGNTRLRTETAAVVGCHTVALVNL